MMNKCRNLRQRHKKGQLYYFCAKRREIVELCDCRGCFDKEYKEVKKITAKKPINKVSKTNKVTKATSITKDVKLKVWERDNKMCIFCHKPVTWNCANSHYIKRSHLGMGIEENIFAACPTCHHEFDDTPKREFMLPTAKRHLMSKYDYWNEEMLVYSKQKKTTD